MSASRIAMVRRRRRRTGVAEASMSGRHRIIFGVLAVLGFFVVSAGLVAGGGAMYAVSRYNDIAGSVVPPEVLIAEQSSGGATILDRNGEFLYEFVDSLSGLRRPVSLDGISQELIDATIAVEDPSFYDNNGVNIRGLVRAGVENFAPFLVEGGGDEFFEGSGGSSITQQLAKNIYIPLEERSDRSVDRKIRETVIALELTEQYAKDQILEWYLNSISYGGIYVGIEAAADGYFGKPASELNLAEASLLAGIPQSPAMFDPFSPTNRDKDTGQLSPTSLAKQRQSEVLQLMVRRGVITQDESDAALNADLAFNQQRFPIEAPHFVLGRIADEIQARFGERALYDQGLVVHTSLDLNLQHMAEEVVEIYVRDYGEQANVYNGALVAIDPRTGELLAYVGSRDYFRDDIEGRNDNAVGLNSPGSTLKPFAFMTAFMQGWGTGAGVIAAPFEIVDFATGDVFSPRDPISQALGPITAASALGNSLNTTAIKTILAAGVPETIETLKRVGYTTFDNPGGYGPALITGGSEITLLDEVYAYSVLATNGVMRGQEALTTLRLDPDERDLEPTAILRVTDAQDRVIYEPEPQEEQVVGAEYAYQVTSILSDGSNQCITYGVCNALALDNGYPSAAKTGTSEPFADSREIGETWTVGYTPELVSGFWAGNADNAPIPGHLLTSTTVSLRGWKDFMVQAIEYLQLPDTDFERPAGVVSRQVCWPSGRLPTPSCPNLNRYESLYAEEVLPRGDYEDLSLEDRERLYDTWWQTVRIDTRTGRIASDQTPARYVSQQSRLVLPPEEVKLWGGFAAWAAANGVSGRVASGGAQPGGATADGDLAARIDSPGWGQVLSGAVNIRGRASSPDFQSFRLEWGRGNSPAAWVRINSGTSPVEGGTLGTWNTTGMADGAYTIRLLVDDAEAGRLFYQINVQVGVGGSTGDGGGTDGGGTDGGGNDGGGDPGGGGGTDGGGTDGGGGAPVVAISSPGQLAVVSGSISISGTASSQRLLQTRVEVTGNGATTVLARLSNNVEGGVLATWDTTTVPNGQYTIRVTLIDHQQGDSTTEHNVVVQN